MPPPAKKTKIEPVVTEPIVFTKPGQKPDVLLRVFDAEYHVFGAVLKLNSSYFQKFLEPEKGVRPKSSSPLFKSEWYTVVDPDGTWALSSQVVCAFGFH